MTAAFLVLYKRGSLALTRLGFHSGSRPGTAAEVWPRCRGGCAVAAGLWTCPDGAGGGVGAAWLSASSSPCSLRRLSRCDGSVSSSANFFRLCERADARRAALAALADMGFPTAGQGADVGVMALTVSGAAAGVLGEDISGLSAIWAATSLGASSAISP